MQAMKLHLKENIPAGTGTGSCFSAVLGMDQQIVALNSFILPGSAGIREETKSGELAIYT